MALNDWEAKLDQLLSDPNAMAQVMNLAKSLSGQSDAQESPASESKTAPKAAGSSADFLSGFDPELLARILPMLRQLNRPESSESSAFLYALRPFLKESRRDKVDRAVQLSRIIHLAKTFLTTQEG